MADPDAMQEKLHAALQDIPVCPDPDESMDGAVLTRWLVVREWMKTDGDRSLSFVNSSSCNVWDVVGMCESVKHWRLVDSDDD